jgi:hypothetical protein
MRKALYTAGVTAAVGALALLGAGAASASVPGGSASVDAAVHVSTVKTAVKTPVKSVKVKAKPAVIKNTLASGVNVTTNNGVAGYYSDGDGGTYSYLNYDLTTNSTDNNMIANQDGIGGQLCDADNGDTAGIGLERVGPNSYEVFYGYGQLSGDPGAVDSNGQTDTNDCLGGILPQADIKPLSLDEPINNGDTVQFQIKVWENFKTKREHMLFQATDLSGTGDTFSALLKSKKNQIPYFGQAGVGAQRTLTGLTSPVNTSNVLVNASDIVTEGWAGDNFGCTTETDEVNSSATSNNGAFPAQEPNAFAQVDPADSLSGGCGTPASLDVYEGQPVS